MLDIRVTQNARFMDQKVTPDVLSCVAECVLELLKSRYTFGVRDLLNLEHSQYLVSEIFNKPDIKKASNEYDKFFAQPLKTLAYAGVLGEHKNGTSNSYVGMDFDKLQSIASSDRKAYVFLTDYLESVLKESGIWDLFENFFANQDESSFWQLKNGFESFILENTNINQTTEIRRIFPKVLNPLSVKFRSKGTQGGFLSSGVMTFSDLLYNRVNFRDIGKDKNMTRAEFGCLSENFVSDRYFDYAVTKAKNLVKKLHPFSEIHRFPNYHATQMHHIFPVYEFPEFASFAENIIAITPNQHFLFAHFNNNTHIVSKNYQLVCLLCKLDSIEADFYDGGRFYDVYDFVYMINSACDVNLNFSTFEQLKFDLSALYVA